MSWPDASDWPSDRAQYLMTSLVGGKPVALFDDDLAKLDERERYLLEKAARKRGYEAWIDRDRGCRVLLPPSPFSSEGK